MIDVEGYLDRIGHQGGLEPTAETLRALHRAHLLAVPFENLDIHRGRWITLEVPALYRKVVGERRGGFCYELNGLFAGLLRALGYEVSLLEARVHIGDGDRYGAPFDHLVLAVRCPGAAERWLADVGFGDSYLEPLRLVVGEEQVDATGAYRIDEGDGDLVLLRRAPGAAWRPAHRFVDYPHELASFAAMCRYHQTSPRSPFTQRSVCSLATPTGRLTLRDTRLIVTDGEQRSEHPIEDEAAWREALRTRFGVELA
jgi:N-hydroxyarylamine O-acetyltransferase